MSRGWGELAASQRMPRATSSDVHYTTPGSCAVLGLAGHSLCRPEQHQVLELCPASPDQDFPSCGGSPAPTHREQPLPCRLGVLASAGSVQVSKPRPAQRADSTSLASFLQKGIKKGVRNLVSVHCLAPRMCRGYGPSCWSLGRRRCSALAAQQADSPCTQLLLHLICCFFST